MTDAPTKRPRGRPRSASPLTVAERSRRYREDMGTMRLPRDMLDALDAQAAQHGDRSRLAVVQRLLALAS